MKRNEGKEGRYCAKEGAEEMLGKRKKKRIERGKRKL